MSDAHDGQLTPLARRRAAAERYKPVNINVLLVADAPPSNLERYFYFEDVTEHDGLFRNVCQVMLGEVPSRWFKAEQLARLQARGVFLIDLYDGDYDGRASATPVEALIERCRTLAPKHIILIKVTVYDVAYRALHAAGVPVVDASIPFPGSGQQTRFTETFGRALSAIHWSP